MSTTLTEDDQKFIEAVRASVAERGAAWVYPPAVPLYGDTYKEDEWHYGEWGACVYSKGDGTPACIIGLALSKIDPALVPVYGDTRNASAVLSHLPLKLSEGAILAARYAQMTQDEGDSWGEALKAFEDRLRREVEK